MEYRGWYWRGDGVPLLTEEEDTQWAFRGGNVLQGISGAASPYYALGYNLTGLLITEQERYLLVFPIVQYAGFPSDIFTPPALEFVPRQAKALAFATAQTVTVPLQFVPQQVFAYDNALVLADGNGNTLVNESGTAIAPTSFILRANLLGIGIAISGGQYTYLTTETGEFLSIS